MIDLLFSKILYGWLPTPTYNAVLLTAPLKLDCPRLGVFCLKRVAVENPNIGLRFLFELKPSSASYPKGSYCFKGLISC